MNIFQLWKKKSFKFSFNNLSSPQKTNVFCFEQYCNSLIFLHLRTDIFFRIFSHIFLKYFWDCCSFSEGKKRKQNKKKKILHSPWVVLSRPPKIIVPFAVHRSQIHTNSSLKQKKIARKHFHTLVLTTEDLHVKGIIDMRNEKRCFSYSFLWNRFQCLLKYAWFLHKM